LSFDRAGISRRSIVRRSYVDIVSIHKAVQFRCFVRIRRLIYSGAYLGKCALQVLYHCHQSSFVHAVDNCVRDCKWIDFLSDYYFHLGVPLYFAFY